MAHLICRPRCLLACSLLLLNLSACQTPSQGVAPRPVSRNLAAVQEQIKLMRRYLVRVQSSLKSLGEAPPDDLQRAFSSFESALNTLGSEVGGSIWLGGISQPPDAEYFKTLAKELHQIEEEDLRIRGEDQHDFVISSYREIQNQFSTLRADFGPFMNNMLDIRRKLSLSLTPQTRTAASPMIAQTLTQSEAVLNDVDALLNGLAKLRGF